MNDDTLDPTDNQPFSVPMLMREVDPIHLGHYTQIAQSMASQQIQNSLANAASQGITPEQWTRFVVDQANLQAAQNQKPDQPDETQSFDGIATKPQPLLPATRLSLGEGSGEPNPSDQFENVRRTEGWNNAASDSMTPPTPPSPPTQQPDDNPIQSAINKMPGIPAHVKAEFSDPEMLATIVAGFLGGGFQSLSHAALSAYQGAQQRADRQNQANQDTYDNQMEQWRAQNDNTDSNDNSESTSESTSEAPDTKPHPTAVDTAEQVVTTKRNSAIAKGITDVHGRTWLSPSAIAKVGQDTKYFSNIDAANWAQSNIEQQIASRLMSDPATAAVGLGRLRREIQRQKGIVLLHRDYLLSQNEGQVPTKDSPLFAQWQDMGQKLDDLSRKWSQAQIQFRTLNPKLDINQAMSADDGGSIFAPQMTDSSSDSNNDSDQEDSTNQTNPPSRNNRRRRKR